MTAVAKDFTATGVGNALSVKNGDSFTYAVAGTFVGTVKLQESRDGGSSWVTLVTATGVVSSTTRKVENGDGQGSMFRFQCTAFTSGTIETDLDDVSSVAQSFRDQDGTERLQVVEGGAKVVGTLEVTGAATLSSSLALTGTMTAGGLTMSGPIYERKGSDVASAATLDLDAANGNVIDVTGTTGITAVTLATGRRILVRFTGALTLTHGASLVLPGAANITTAAGDYAEFVGYASGVVRVSRYVKAASMTATLGGTETLTNKTLTDPTVNAGGGVIVLPAAASPAQTAEGSVVWDSDDDVLTVGDGSGRKTMVDLAKAQTLTNKTLDLPVVTRPTLTVTAEAVAAAGSTQGDAGAVTAASGAFIHGTGADGTKGIVLPAAAAGKIYFVKNADAANAILKVYPASGDEINALAADAALSMAAKTSATFIALDATTWYTIPLLPS